MPAYETLHAVSRRSIFFVLMGFSGVLGIACRSTLLLALFEALLGLAVVSWLCVRVVSSRIAAARTVAPRAYEEDEVRVTLRLWNRSVFPAWLVEVRDWFSADGLPEKRALVSVLRATDDPTTIEYAGSCSHGRGKFSVGPLEIEVCDPLGLFPRVTTFPALSELVVYPKVFPVRDPAFQELQWKAPLAAGGDRAGHASTFLGTREYRPGDNIRHLHWPSYARWGRLILKEFEQDASLEVTCFLDLDAAALRGVGRGSNVDQAVRISASMAAAVTGRLGAFQLIADAGTPIVLPARHGRSQMLAVLDTLSQVRATGKTRYLDLVSSGLRFVPEGGVAVLIFNTLDADPVALAGVLSGLARRRARLLPVVLDDTTFIALESAKPRPEEAARRLERLTGDLARFGLSPIVVRSGDDLSRLFTGEDRVAPASRGFAGVAP